MYVEKSVWNSNILKELLQKNYTYQIKQLQIGLDKLDIAICKAKEATR